MRETIEAREGYVLTDGTTYGTTIHLAEGADASVFREITREEYDAIMDAQQEPSEDGATEADYIAALEQMGVKL